MNSRDEDRARATAADWLPVCDELLWGFNHALSNRLAALTSITKILEHSETGVEPLLTALADEIGTLERTLDLLRLVPREAEAGPEPVRVEDLLPDVIRLHELRGGPSEVECDVRYDGEPQPVWMERAALGHALLVAVGAGCRASAERGAFTLVVRVTSREDSVTVEIGPAGEGRPVGEADGVLGQGREVALARALVEGTGGVFGEIGAGSGGPGYRLRWPTLLAVRASERDRVGGSMRVERDADGGGGPGATISSSV